jgi:hypothetical protein
MSAVIGSIGAGFATAWGAFVALVKSGISSGAIQAIAGAVVALGHKPKEASQSDNLAIAVKDVMDFFDPDVDNIKALTHAIARLSYVLEQELKAREGKASETKSQ